MAGFERNIAIVIGINRYGNGIPPLQSAVPDAEAIAQILQDEHHYDVQLCLDEAATLEGLTVLFQQLQPQLDDRLLFYFAGHGIAIMGDEGPEGYLIPQDARLGEVSTYFRMTEVEAALTPLSCRHCLIILDCCFAGAFRWSSTRKLEVIPEVIHKERYDRFIDSFAWQVITSASHDQYALDTLDLKNDRGTDRTRTQHSPFAAALMDALSGDADIYPPGKSEQPPGDGVITATELYLYLRDTVEVPTDAHTLRQTPGLWCLKKHDRGEYIFLTPGHILNLPAAPSLEPTEKDNPYRGLKSYEKEHGALFFGRTSLIEELCNFLCDRPFTVVLGASGSGKSSLVKAGLIPHLEGFESQKLQSSQKLKRKGQLHQHQQWEILAIVRPTEAPLTALQEALQESRLLIANKLQTAPTDSQTLISVIQNWSQHYSDKKLLLVIDQAEELITQCRDEEEREQFLHLLTDMLRECSSHLHIVLTLRSDFEPQLCEYSGLKSQWISSRFVIPTMTREELRDVIEGPASAKVVHFETHEQRGSLVDQLIKEVEAMPGTLPLLSFALSELYFKLVRRFRQAQIDDGMPDRAITWQDYDELGGVPRSLTGRADQEYDALIQKDLAYAQTTRNVMLRMVNIDGGSATKRKVPFSELKYPDPENDRVNRVVEQFVQARLLVRDNDKDIPYVEPAHDALIQG
jgi:energy-coupling factor transporter ATP-binding protein EcfA2